MKKTLEEAERRNKEFGLKLDELIQEYIGNGVVPATVKGNLVSAIFLINIKQFKKVGGLK